MADHTRFPGRRPSFGADDGDRDGDGSAAAEPSDSGRRGQDEALAPVIPLFGARRSPRSDHPSARGDEGVSDRDHDAPRPRPASGRWGRSADAPASNAAGSSPPFRGPAQTGRSADGQTLDDHVEPSAEEVRERAEALLVRRLRSRSLSLSEARTVVRGVDGVDDVLVDEVIAHFIDLGYLDDATFAEQLVMSAVERRGEGRRAVAETLRKRGVPRDVADATIAELPDDDAERALEFARSKARAVGGKDFDASLRRLAGQLARRGYPSSIALTAARTALDEVGVRRSRHPAGSSSGVRFTPDD